MVPRRAARRLSAQNSSQTRRDPRKRRRFVLNYLERLEDRINLATTYTWQQTVAGTFNWNSPSNWSAQGGTGTYPQAGDVAELTSGLTGNETILLNSNTTVDLLEIGAVGSAYTFTVEGANSLTTTTGIQKSSGGADVISAPIVATGGLHLMDSSSAGLTITGTISGAGSLTKSRNADDVLSGTNTYTGSTTVNGGTLSVSSDANLGADPSSATPGNIVLSGGALQVTGSGNFSFNSNRGIAVGGSFGSGAIAVNSGNPLSYGGVVANNGTGTGGLTVDGNGSGTLVLTGSNTYTGGTTISAGTLQIGNGGSLGSGTVTDNTSLVFNNDTSTVPDSISGPGTVTMEGGGTVTLSGTNTYTGGTTITAGTLETGNAASLGSGPLTLNGGTLSAGPSASITGFAGNGTGWTINNSGITSTAITNNVLTLTDGNTNEARSAFDNTPVATAGNFIASFTYTASGNRAADGVAFVLQNSTARASALGGTGGGLGYGANGGIGGISNSIAVALNIYSGVGVGTNRFTSGSIGTYNPTSPVTLNDGNAQNITLIYNAAAQTLSETITDQAAGQTFATTYTGVSLSSIIGGGTAYVGFTGGTGGSTSTQTISNFSFSEPTVAGFGGSGNGWSVQSSGISGTAVSNDTLTLTDNNPSEAPAPLTRPPCQQLATSPPASRTRHPEIALPTGRHSSSKTPRQVPPSLGSLAARSVTVESVTASRWRSTFTLAPVIPSAAPSTPTET